MSVCKSWASPSHHRTRSFPIIHGVIQPTYKTFYAVKFAGCCRRPDFFGAGSVRRMRVLPARRPLARPTGSASRRRTGKTSIKMQSLRLQMQALQNQERARSKQARIIKFQSRICAMRHADFCPLASAMPEDARLRSEFCAFFETGLLQARLRRTTKKLASPSGPAAGWVRQRHTPFRQSAQAPPDPGSCSCRLLRFMPV